MSTARSLAADETLIIEYRCHCGVIYKAQQALLKRMSFVSRMTIHLHSMTEELTGSNDITLKNEYGAKFVIPCKKSEHSVLPSTDA